MFWYSMIHPINDISGTLKVEEGNLHIQCKKINISSDVANDLEVWYALLKKRISLHTHIVPLAFDKPSGDPKSRNNYFQHGFSLISLLRPALFYELINNLKVNALLHAVSFSLYPKQLGVGGVYTPPDISSSTHRIKLKLTPDTIPHKNLRLMTSLLQWRDMGTIYRPAKMKTWCLISSSIAPVPFKVLT